MQNLISDSLKSDRTEARAKEFLQQFSNRFTTNVKMETSTTLTKLVTMQYKENGNIREYITEMSNLVTKLSKLKLELSENILIHMVLISLLAQYNTLKISYSTPKEKWSMNVLIAQ